jgi:hypothetical protein
MRHDLLAARMAAYSLTCGALPLSTNYIVVDSIGILQIVFTVLQKNSLNI